MTRKRYEVLKSLYQAHGDLAYSLAVFGDDLAKREQYKSVDLTGMDAIYFYLSHKYKWMPKDVKAMSFEDIRFILTEDMDGWVMPKFSRI